jgi:hypothetical protein
LALPHRKDGKTRTEAAGWGHVQTSRTGSTLVMPGMGLATERDYTSDERGALLEEPQALGEDETIIFDLLGHQTFDIHLNAEAVWTNVPSNVWNYFLGGYPVIKKWLSYREAAILGRPLKTEEATYVSEMVRRIAAILLLSPSLDANYAASKANVVKWKDGRPVTQ